MASLSEPRLVDGCRYIRDLCIIDGTRVNDKVAVPTIALFYTRPTMTSDPPEIHTLAQLRGSATAVTFFGFHNTKKEHGFQLENASDCCWKEAKDTPKAKQLSDEATTIHGTSAADRESIGGSSFTPLEKRLDGRGRPRDLMCSHGMDCRKD